MTRLTIAAALLATLFGAPTASASDFSGPTNSVGCLDGLSNASGPNQDDGGDHSVRYINLTPRGDEAARWGALEVHISTRTVVEVSSTASWTDVLVTDAAYTTACNGNWRTPTNPTGIGGMYTCLAIHASGRCDQSRIRLSTTWLDEHNNLAERRYLGTHEFGHSLGLLHRGAGVEVMSPSTVTANKFAVHDFCHINAWCGGLGGTSDVFQLNSGDEVRSGQGTFRLIMQGDGNLVLYKNSTALWSTLHEGVPLVVGSRAVMQGDGNFVLYRPSGTPGWHTVTYGNPGARLIVQVDGNLVLRSSGGTPLWDSGTAGS